MKTAPTETKLAEAIATLLCADHTDDMLSGVMDKPISIEGARSFEADGVLTQNAGFTLRLDGGVEYQITVVRSR